VQPLVIGTIAFVLISAGAFAGWTLKKLLPKQHLTEETKNLVSVSTAVVATVSALVLGLLISNANASFIRLGGEVTTLSAEIVRLDRILLRYGSDAEPAREVLLRYAKQKATDMFPDYPSPPQLGNPSTYELLQQPGWFNFRAIRACAREVPDNAGRNWWVDQPVPSTPRPRESPAKAPAEQWSCD
jgi:hypothetical protein